MAEFGLLDDEEVDDMSGAAHWSAVANLDVFFSKMYYYHYERGLHACISNGAVSLITLGFTLFLSTIIFAFIDWPKLMTCTDEESCSEDFGEYWASQAVTDPSGYHVLVWFYFAFFSAYWIFSALVFVQRVKDALEMHRFYKNHLGVPDSALASGAFTWAAVVERFQDMHRAGKLRVAIGRAADALDAHWIAARIMRKENYLTAILNHGVLDLHLQWRKWAAQGIETMELWGNAAYELVQGGARGETDELRRPLRAVPGGFSGGSDLFEPASRSASTTGGPSVAASMASDIGSSEDELEIIATTKIHIRRNRLWAEGADVAFFNKSIEWALHACLLGYMFSDTFTLRHEFLLDRDGLRRRFILAGIAHVILMPFLLVFMLALFFLQHAQEWRASNNYLGPREWSPLARCMFREFNELPHVFEERLARTIGPATDYQGSFSRPLLATAGRLLSFISGALVAVLLVFTLMDESILLYTKLWGRNLLWYMGILSATFAVSRGLGTSSVDEKKRQNQAALDGSVDPHTTDDLMTKVRLPKDPPPPGAVGGIAETAGGANGNGGNGIAAQANGYGSPEHPSREAATQLEPMGHPKVAEELMLRVAAHTHYLPDAWRGRCHTPFVRDAFLRLFQYKAALFAQEALAVVFAPLILCFCLPACTDRILQYMRLYSVDVEGVGTVCCFSTFDVNQFGDPTFMDNDDLDGGNDPEEKSPEHTLAAAGDGSEQEPLIRPSAPTPTYPGSARNSFNTSSFMGGGSDASSFASVDARDFGFKDDDGDAAFTALKSMRQLGVLRNALEGKMEKSLISFATEHPSWSPPSSARCLLQRVTRLRFGAMERRRAQILGEMASSRNLHDQQAAQLFQSMHGGMGGVPRPAAYSPAFSPEPYMPPRMDTGGNGPETARPDDKEPAATAQAPTDLRTDAEPGVAEPPSEEPNVPRAEPAPLTNAPPAMTDVTELQRQTTTESLTSPPAQFPFAREPSDEAKQAGSAASGTSAAAPQEGPFAPQPGYRDSSGLLSDGEPSPSGAGPPATAQPQRPVPRSPHRSRHPLSSTDLSGLISPPLSSMSPPLWSPTRAEWIRRGSSGGGSAPDATASQGLPPLPPHGSASSFMMPMGGSSILYMSQLPSMMGPGPGYSMGVAMSNQAAIRAAALASIGSGMQPWDNSFYWMEQGQREQAAVQARQGLLSPPRLGSPEPSHYARRSHMSSLRSGGAGNGRMPPLGPERSAQLPPVQQRAPPRDVAWTRAGHVNTRSHPVPGGPASPGGAANSAAAQALNESEEL
uniref:Autophagy-related protein 9 n=1 Tax=Phaeomonas parva TaxID=124430 RepID=A0A7S1U8L1_9STRA